MRRHAAFQDLSRDHFTGLMRCLQVTRSIEGHPSAPAKEPAKAALMALWHDALATHFDEEDADLLPYLEPDLADRLKEDHARLRAAFVAPPTSDDDFAQVAEDLRQHIRWEEDKMFPWLQKNLDEATLQALWQTSRAFRIEHRGPSAVQDASYP